MCGCVCVVCCAAGVGVSGGVLVVSVGSCWVGSVGSVGFGRCWFVRVGWVWSVGGLVGYWWVRLGVGYLGFGGLARVGRFGLPPPPPWETPTLSTSQPPFQEPSLVKPSPF